MSRFLWFTLYKLTQRIMQLNQNKTKVSCNYTANCYITMCNKVITYHHTVNRQTTFICLLLCMYYILIVTRMSCPHAVTCYSLYPRCFIIIIHYFLLNRSIQNRCAQTSTLHRIVKRVLAFGLSNTKCDGIMVGASDSSL